ncbi:peptidoglycan DD-metalloendopeptidase family protein [Altererythrobacter sp. H2]|uniref:M23 family metallopeptidase n=1 Tax=Altererythrobacter sp. H2 TaxID=3108391 RepID=UPI002B4C0400|nr:peptidoglycan DD-metalloendopeptidase family protein [Altererythrobacter sp. H2]WRK96029.1 peptidoglycan DD-metalloendopeptidase family protein [Altererythrobacter sp. H2]
MYSERDVAGIEAALADQGGWRAVALAHTQLAPDPRPRILQRTGTMLERYDSWRHDVSDRLERLNLTPDLASGIGSRTWFRGLGTLIGLSALAIGFWPSFGPLEAAPAMLIDEPARDEFRSHMIMPLALGGDSGRHMGATLDVKPLRSAPERPTQQLLATLSRGDSFARMLERAGVGGADASRVLGLVSNAIDLTDVTPGTQVDITLGRRTSPGQPRPLDSLAFRARFDLALEVSRGENGLVLTRKPIRVDDTPLRIRGNVGRSLYRSLRAAGAPPSAVQQYLAAINDQVDMERSVRASDTFDLIVQYRRAATGEREAGRLVYAGVDRGDKPQVQLMRWGKDGRFYEASGVGEQRAGLLAPVPGRISSNFGMRRHPILGYRRMHSGMDFAAGHGTPIVAVTDGRVSGAGRMGGCGIAVRLEHGGGLSTRYCHMSRMAVRAGQSVRRGQVIGYVGSTGLSTGAHLHYEMYRGGRAVNPASVSFVTRAQLGGEELRRFRATLASLKTVAPGAALVDLAPTAVENANEEPAREIDRLDQARRLP